MWKFKSYLKSNMTAYLALMALVGAMVIGYFGLLHSGISVPIIYAGDGMMHGIEIKSILDTGWYYFNGNIGAPFGTYLADFPRVEMFHFVQIKLLGYLFTDYGRVLNVFYFSGFLLTALSSYWVMRRLGFGIGFALAGTILFCFTPYHLARIEHLFLASYFVVPLAIFLALQLSSDNPPFYTKGKFDIRDYRTLFLTLLIGSAGLYYSFYGVVLILIAALSAALNQRSLCSLKSGTVLSVVITVVLLINVAPSIYYKTVKGGNPTLANRQFMESELYALKLTHLLLPRENHNLESLGEISERYNQILRPRDFSSPLGLVASAGFLLLLITLIFRVGVGENRNLRVLSELNISAFLFGTVGGLGVLFALYVTPSIRSHNRVSIFIAFLSLCGLMIMLQSLLNREGDRRKGGRWLILAPVIITMIGLYDQLPMTREFANRMSNNKVEYHQDRQFVEQIEQIVVPGGMIFQMPYIRFPEEAARWHEGSYGMARGYLHSSQLRWSYGAMKGRKSDALLQTLEEMPLVKKIEALEQHDFQGIYLDRRAYREGTGHIEAQLNKLLTMKPLESYDGNLLFYLLNKHVESERAAYWALFSGFYRWEGSYPNNWRWSDSSPEQQIEIVSNKISKEALVVTLSVGSFFAQTVTVTHLGGKQSYSVEPGKPSLVSLTIPPSEQGYVITFVSDAPVRSPSAAEPRMLGFSISPPKIKVVERK